MRSLTVKELEYNRVCNMLDMYIKKVQSDTRCGIQEIYNTEDILDEMLRELKMKREGK